jgi:hypothetical protein
MHAVNLLWGQSSSSNVGYNVYRGTSPGAEDFTTPLNGGTPIQSTNTNITYSDAAVSGGATYYYKVKAVDLTSGLESTPTNEVTATVPNPQPPQPPGTLQVSSVS